MKNSIFRSLQLLKTFFGTLFRPETIAGVIIAFTIIVVSLNTSGVILQNYRLERDVRIALQKVSIAEIELDTQRFRNEYFKTDAFLEIAARKQLSKGLNGEKLIIVPKSVALAEVPKIDEDQQNSAVDIVETTDLTRFEQWMKFISGDLEYVSKD